MLVRRDISNCPPIKINRTDNSLGGSAASRAVVRQLIMSELRNLPSFPPRQIILILMANGLMFFVY
jgi:hypothetical protein